MTKETAKRIVEDYRREGIVKGAEVHRIDERIGLGEPVEIEPVS
jgi:hypothetical protein